MEIFVVIALGVAAFLATLGRAALSVMLGSLVRGRSRRNRHVLRLQKMLARTAVPTACSPSPPSSPATTAGWSGTLACTKRNSTSTTAGRPDRQPYSAAS